MGNTNQVTFELAVFHRNVCQISRGKTPVKSITPFAWFESLHQKKSDDQQWTMYDISDVPVGQDAITYADVQLIREKRTPVPRMQRTPIDTTHLLFVCVSS